LFATIFLYPKIVGNAATLPPPLTTATSPPKPEGHLFLWFYMSNLIDPVVRQVLHLQPLDTEDDSGGSSNDDEIKIVTGMLLGNDSAVHHVQRVLTNKMQSAVMVTESEDCGIH
jgi:hypothetical protein